MLSFQDGAQDRQDFEVLARPNLKKDVSGSATFGFTEIDQNHRAVFATPRQEFTFLHQRILGEMPWMAFGRIPAPVHNEICSVLYFAKSTRHFTTQLGGDFCGTVSKRGVTVKQPSESIGQRDCFSLSFTGGIAQSVNQRHVSVMQKSGSGFNRLVHCGLASVN